MRLKAILLGLPLILTSGVEASPIPIVFSGTGTNVDGGLPPGGSSAMTLFGISYNQFNTASLGLYGGTFTLTATAPGSTLVSLTCPAPSLSDCNGPGSWQGLGIATDFDSNPQFTDPTGFSEIFTLVVNAGQWGIPNIEFRALYTGQSISLQMDSNPAVTINGTASGIVNYSFAPVAFQTLTITAHAVGGTPRGEYLLHRIDLDEIITFGEIPEPGTFALIGGGLLVLATVRRRLRRA